MTKQLIGTAVTDENGIATLQYKCGGRGQFQITAESGGLVSDTYEVLDTLLYDNGTQANHNDSMWNNWNSSATIERKTDYTSITKASSDTSASWQIPKTKFSNSNLKVEFDVYVDSSVNPDAFLQLRNQAYNVLANISLNNMSLAVNTWHHIILKFNGTTCNISNTTNSNTTNRNLSNIVNKMICRCETNTNEVRYKNFKVYPSSSS